MYKGHVRTIYGFMRFRLVFPNYEFVYGVPYNKDYAVLGVIERYPWERPSIYEYVNLDYRDL